MLLAYSLTSQAQSIINLGIGLGIAAPIPSFPLEERYRIKQAVPLIGITGATVVQYVFSNGFGLETGFKMSFNNYHIKTEAMEEKVKINVNTYSLPFLFLLKVPSSSSPQLSFDFLCGLTVDFPDYLAKGKNHYSVYYLDRKYAMVNIRGDSRMSFNKNEIGIFEFGLSYTYALSHMYNYHIANSMESFHSKVHFLEINFLWFYNIK